jgi:ABC-2 type transport system permease protein
LYFLLSGSYLFLLAVVIIQVLYLIAWKRKKAEVPFPFDHFIEVEQARMMRFYRFANYFTDVPHIQGMTKRRKWLDILYKLAPYEQKNTQFYLVLRTFIRTNDYFYLWIRLTALAIVGAIFIPFPIVAIIFTSALSFATVIQLRQSLSSGYEFRMDLLFPINEGARKKAINRLIRIIQLIQAILVLVVILVQAGVIMELILIPIMMIIVSELTLRVSKL